MRAWRYRITVIGCATTWFLVGLHLTALHEMTHHGGTLEPAVLGVVTALVALALVTLGVLLRTPQAGAR